MGRSTILAVTWLAVLLVLTGFSRAADPAPTVTLAAADAAISGGAAYYPNGKFIGSWTDPKARLQWQLEVAADTTAHVVLQQSCAPDCGGQFQLAIGTQKLQGKTQSTGGWYDYKPMDLGPVTLTKGKYVVTLSAGPFQTAPMNVRAITLAPMEGTAQALPVQHVPGPLTPVYIVPNFHPASCGWLTNWSTERNYCANSYLAHLDRVRTDPSYTFALSECNNMIAIKNFQPERFEELKARIKEGRVECVNAFFLEPTINLSGGEALAKMGIEGLRWQQQIMGTRPRLCWAIDVCGTHDQMPQICTGLELEALIYTRCSRGGKNAFWSEAPDGSRIITLVPGHYSDFGTLFAATAPFGQRQLSDVEHDLAHRMANTPAGAPLLILGGHGDYALPPVRMENPTEFLQAWKAFRPDASVTFSTPGKYLDALLPGVQSGKIQLPSVKGGTGYTFDSFWVECPRVKTWYRRDEHALQAAETLATIASLKAGYDYPVQELYDGWLQMLLNMDRNTLWGSAGGMVFEHETSWDVRDRFQWVQSHSAATLQAAGQKLSGAGTAVALFNPANWKRTDPLRLTLPTGTRLAGVVCQAMDDGTTLCRVDVPATGTIGVALEAQAAAAPQAAELPAAIETKYYTARIDPTTGALVSLKTKPSGREMLSGPANVIVAERHAGHGDPGDFVAARPGRKVLGSSSDVKSTIRVTAGPLATTVEAQNVFYGEGVARRVMRFYKDDPRIEFETDMNDIPNLTVVVAEFPLVQTPSEIRRGIPFGFAHGGWPEPRADLPGWTQGITPALRYVDYTLPAGGGVALLDRGLTGREINDKTPIIYLYNATDKYYGYYNAWLSGKGPHHFEYALVAHETDWNSARVPQLAWEYNCPVTVTTGCAAAAEQSFVTTSDNVIVEVVRRDGADIEVRLAECLGLSGTAEVTVNLPHQGAALTDLVGGHAQTLAGGPTYKFPVRPQQIVTLRCRTTTPVAEIQVRTQWDDLVPPNKLDALRQYQADKKGHPPRGQ